MTAWSGSNKPRRKRPEDNFHITVAQFLDLALPHDAEWTTMDPGSYRTKAEAGLLKAKGLKPGWPDILIIYRGRTICIELKSPKGVLSSAQKAMHERLTLAGALVCTATRLESVESFLRPLIPLRLHTGARAP